jgi:hypothetical protein
MFDYGRRRGRHGLKTSHKLVCRHELNIWIAAEFEWRPLQPASLEQAVGDIRRMGGSRAHPRLVGQFAIELTLTTRRIAPMQRPEMRSWLINEALLTDAAFRPKTYTLRLEQGSFLTPYDARPPGELPQTPRYALRLAFDTSPYPPRDEWREPEGAPDAMKMWEWKEFCARSSPELKKVGVRGLQCVVI